MISSILLAAGQSHRMGEPKPLLDWGGKPLIRYQVEQLLEGGCDEVIVVLGARADLIHRQIAHTPCRVMFNPAYAGGRSGSLRIGARAVNRDASAIVILNVDQPRPADLICSLIEAHTPEAAVTLPTFGGHAGHPVVVAGRLRDELLSVTEETAGLRAVLERHADAITHVAADELCRIDLNTRAEYEHALRRFGLASTDAHHSQTP